MGYGNGAPYIYLPTLQVRGLGLPAIHIHVSFVASTATHRGPFINLIGGVVVGLGLVPISLTLFDSSSPHAQPEPLVAATTRDNASRPTLSRLVNYTKDYRAAWPNLHCN